MQTILIGTIMTGEQTGWKVNIKDDSAGETGGFFLYLIRDQQHGFDSWFETLEQLRREISELEIRWDSSQRL